MGLKETQMTDDAIVTFPVTGWEIKAVPSYDAITVRLEFLSHAMQTLAEADPGRNYVLTTKQAEAFRDAIDRAVLAVRSAPPQPDDNPKH
jgi:BssS protein family